MVKQIFYKEYFCNANGSKKRNRVNLGQNRPKRGEDNTHLKNKKIFRKKSLLRVRTQKLVFFIMQQCLINLLLINFQKN